MLLKVGGNGNKQTGSDGTVSTRGRSAAAGWLHCLLHCIEVWALDKELVSVGTYAAAVVIKNRDFNCSCWGPDMIFTADDEMTKPTSMPMPRLKGQAASALSVQPRSGTSTRV